MSIIFATIILAVCFFFFICMIKNNFTKSKTGLETEEVDELEEYDDPILQKSKERRRKFIERKKTIGSKLELPDDEHAFPAEDA